MNLAGVDLNLLVAFDALLSEGSGECGRRPHRPQSARNE